MISLLIWAKHFEKVGILYGEEDQKEKAKEVYRIILEIYEKLEKKDGEYGERKARIEEKFAKLSKKESRFRKAVKHIFTGFWKKRKENKASVSKKRMKK